MSSTLQTLITSETTGNKIKLSPCNISIHSVKCSEFHEDCPPWSLVSKVSMFLSLSFVHNSNNISKDLWFSLSVLQFSSSVVSNSLHPHELQHARPPCPSLTPRVHSNSRLSSQWCHPAISSSVTHFSFCPQSLPASESFPMSQLFAWGGQSTGVSALASFLPNKRCQILHTRLAENICHSIWI